MLGLPCFLVAPLAWWCSCNEFVDVLEVVFELQMIVPW